MNSIAIINDNKSLAPVKPFDPHDPSWIAEYSHIYINPINYRELVSMFFSFDLVNDIVSRNFFGAKIHQDERIPRYNKVLAQFGQIVDEYRNGQHPSRLPVWVDDTSSMAIFGIRRGEQWAGDNKRTMEEIDRFLAENTQYEIHGKIAQNSKSVRQLSDRSKEADQKSKY